MGTELLLPFASVLFMLLSLLAASCSSALFSRKYDVIASSIFGLCVGVVVLLPALWACQFS